MSIGKRLIRLFEVASDVRLQVVLLFLYIASNEAGNVTMRD
jgi:hypothetical protein